MSRCAEVPMLLSASAQELLQRAAALVAEEGCANGCAHQRGCRADPLRCSHFRCGDKIIECTAFCARAGRGKR